MIPRPLGALAALLGVVLAGARAVDKPAAPPGKKPPRKAVNILLLSDTQNREFQFTRLMLRGEVPRWGGELFFHLQQPPRHGITADTEPPDQLERFPTALKVIDRTKPTKDRLSNLAWFDVVVAFDANWKKLDPRAVALLRRWVKDGGALVFVAGPLNTPALTEAGAGRAWLKAILDLLPVVPDAGRAELLRPAQSPRRLHFSGPARDLAFLRLDPARAGVPLSGWQTFFRGVEPGRPQEMPSPEGFSTLFPVRRVKNRATVLATFAGPRARTADGAEQPCLVSIPCGRGRVVYLGCSESWRLRKSSEDYHRRFWGGLVQYAAGSTPPPEKRTSEILIGSRFTTGELVEVAVRLAGPDGRPLPAASKWLFGRISRKNSV